MYERIQGNDMYNGATNSPFGATVNFNNVALTAPLSFVQSGVAITPAAAPITVNGITGIMQNDYKAPLSNQYSIGVQQQLAKNTVLSVSYVGNENRHQQSYTEINLPATNLLPGLIAGTVQKNYVVPYLGLGSIRMGGNNVNSHYNGVQAELHSQVGNYLTLNAAYTFSKAYDPTNAGGSVGDMNNVSDPYNRNYDVGPSPLDRRNVALVNFVYDLPILRGNSGTRMSRAVLGGWELSGIITAESGFPLNINEGGSLGSNGLPNSTNRPNFTGSISYPQTLAAWFNTSGFADPQAGQWGSFARNTVYGPGRDNWNVSLFKSFTFSESRGSKLELRVETFNTFNHTQWQNVSSSKSAGDFGQVTSTYNPRNIQLGVKLLF